jgi:FkbM family methyltransferase
MEQHMAPGKLCVDVGAFIGDGAVYLGLRNPTVTILAFEANPLMYQCLVKNIAENQLINVIPYPFAVYDGTCDTICFPKPDLAVGLDGFGAFGVDPGRADGDIVLAVSLDKFVGDAPVSVIKVDVEGADLHVLRGCKRLMTEQRPTFVYEERPGDQSATRDGVAYAPFHSTRADYASFFRAMDYVEVARMRHDVVVCHTGDSMREVL